uniref:Leucine-rich repeat-containing protein 51 n=1 Tax=Globodera pallida TaxID=36090 RepID=A0A183CCC8_GLOPA
MQIIPVCRAVCTAAAATRTKLRKASRKLSQLSKLGELHHHGSSTRETESLNGGGSEVSGADSSDCSTTDDLTVLDCSNLNLEALHIVMETGAERKKNRPSCRLNCSPNTEDIEHLILDENELDEQALEDIPRLDKLETLSLNGNQIKNIGVLLQYLKRKCPNLKFLSLIGNPGWPHPILNDNLQLYRTYACSTICTGHRRTREFESKKQNI